MRRLPPGRRHRAVPARDRGPDQSALERHRRRGQERDHAALAAGAEVTGLRRRAAAPAERERARSDPRVGQGRGPHRRPGAEAAPAVEDSRPPGRDDPRPEDARRLPPERGEGHDRRLPLLPPRPADEREHVRHLRPHRAGRAQGRPPRDPLPRRALAGRRGEAARRKEPRPGLELLRRNRPLGRHDDGRDPGLAERRELGRCLGAGVGRQPPTRRHGRPASGGKPDRDAGALQPAERAHAGPLASGADGRTCVGQADADPHDAPPRPRRARVHEGRAGPPLLADGGAARALAASTGRKRASSRPACCSSAAGTLPRRARAPSRPATGASRSRRRSTSQRGTCTCSAPRSSSS